MNDRKRNQEEFAKFKIYTVAMAFDLLAPYMKILDEDLPNRELHDYQEDILKVQAHARAFVDSCLKRIREANQCRR